MVASNLIPYQNKWLVSYETLLFNTADGDLDTTQYALDGNGTGYYVRTVPKNQGQFQHVDLTYDVSKLTQVQIVPGSHAYYDEFLTAVGATNIATMPTTRIANLPAGSVVRVASTAVAYNPLRTVPNAPQPSRTEQVSVLPPPIPGPNIAEHYSIGFDATSNSGAKSSVSSYSWSHTCAGTNLLLVFGDSHYIGTGGTDITVSAVTYNAVSLASVRSDVSSWGTTTHGYVRSSIFYLIAPATGSHTVSITYSGTVDYGAGGVVSYTGAKQSGQPDAQNGYGCPGCSANPATVNVTTVADNCWVFSVLACSYYDSTYACGNTQRWVFGLSAEYTFAGSDTNGPVHPAGQQAMTWTQQYAYKAISAASFAPIPDPAYIKQDRITLTSLTADPASCVAGDVWFRSDLGNAKLAIDTVVANAKLIA